MFANVLQERAIVDKKKKETTILKKEIVLLQKIFFLESKWKIFLKILLSTGF